MKKKEKERKENILPDEKENEKELKRKKNVRDLLRNFEPEPGTKNITCKERKLLTPKRRKENCDKFPTKDLMDEKTRKGDEKVRVLAQNFGEMASKDEKLIKVRKRDL